VARNIGSKTERSPGVWRLRVTAGYDPITNKPIQKSMTFKGSGTPGGEGSCTHFAANAPKGSAGVGRRRQRLWLKSSTAGWTSSKARLGGKTFLSYESFMKRVKADLGHLPITMFEKRKGGQLLDKQYERWLAAGVPAGNSEADPRDHAELPQAGRALGPARLGGHRPRHSAQARQAPDP
jgi:hypothetical protein